MIKAQIHNLAWKDLIYTSTMAPSRILTDWKQKHAMKLNIHLPQMTSSKDEMYSNKWSKLISAESSCAFCYSFFLVLSDWFWYGRSKLRRRSFHHEPLEFSAPRSYALPYWKYCMIFIGSPVDHQFCHWLLWPSSCSLRWGKGKGSMAYQAHYSMLSMTCDANVEYALELDHSLESQNLNLLDNNHTHVASL